MTNDETQNQHAAKESPSESAVSAVEFKLSNNLIIVNASINGVSGPMILDTGAGRTVVNRKAARMLGLQETHESCTGRGAGGEVEMVSTTIESLAIGSVSQADLTPVTMDMADLCEQLESEVHGIIGFDFLSKFKLTIDYPKQQLALEKTANPE